jgi:hypothetical protein
MAVTHHGNLSDSSVGVINGTATPGNLQLWVGLEDKNHYQQFSFVKFDTSSAPSGKILGWEISMAPQAQSNGWAQPGGTNFVFGLLEPDGLWDGAGGFSLTNYPTWQSYPRPTNAAHTIQTGTLFQNAWLGTTLFPATLDVDLQSPMSFGEGLSGTGRGASDYPLVGTIPAVQAYINAHGLGPICFVFTVFQDTATYRDRRFIGGLSGFPLVGPQLYTSVDTLPVITSTPVTDAQTYAAYAYQVTYTDDGPTAGNTITLQVAPTGMTIDDQETFGDISWVPTASQVGAHNVTVRVTDSANQTVDQSFVINVVDLLPVITSTPVTEAQANAAPYAYRVTYTDDGPTTGNTVTLQVAPTGMTIDDQETFGDISWDPTFSQVGTHNVTVRVTDFNSQTVDQSFVITVLNTVTQIEAGDITRNVIEAAGDLTRRTSESAGGITRQAAEAAGDLTRRASEPAGDLTRRTTTVAGDLKLE